MAIGQGDGWLRAFDAHTGVLEWQFDLNRKQERIENRDLYAGIKVMTESPVFDGRYLFATIGNDRETSNTTGRIYCIDPFRKGDISEETEVGGEKIQNPNSGLMWQYSGTPEQNIATSLGGLCVTNELLIASTVDGWVYCFEKTHGEILWKYDMWAPVIGTPLVVGDKLYISDEDGDIEILRASGKLEVLNRIQLGAPIESSPIFANKTLFIVTRKNLFAVGD